MYYNSILHTRYKNRGMPLSAKTVGPATTVPFSDSIARHSTTRRVVASKRASVAVIQVVTCAAQRKSGSQQANASGDDAVVFTSPALSDVSLEAPQEVKKAVRKQPSQNINIIPIGRWSDGIPPAMGGHFMPSGELAPLSKSKGPGVDIAPLYFKYPDSTTETDVIIHDTAFSAANGLADLVAEASAKAIAQKNSFTIALSGGSLVKSLSALVGRDDVDFSKWFVFFSDERVVSLSSPDSNYKAAADEFLSKVPIPSSQIIKIKEGLPATQAAEHYAGQMLDLNDSILPRSADAMPVLDMVLLGVGPDGHVASLFPNSQATSATNGWVLPVVNSPKPPSERITLTMPAINAAKNVIVCALGEGKSEVVQRALEVQSLPGALPVQLVRPQERLSWVLDKASASDLSVESWDEKKNFPRSSFE